MTAFFNFVINILEKDFPNPCETPLLKKVFRKARTLQWTIFEKEKIDETIYRTLNPRNRIILELMARAGMRISEVLGLRPCDIEGCKLILRLPKSGKSKEVVYIAQKLCNRMQQYIHDKEIPPDKKIFPISYPTARVMVKKAGRVANVKLRPHDLRRFAATYASRCGTPIEIISKVILRHASLSTTQRYLGKVSDEEAKRWIENLYT